MLYAVLMSCGLIVCVWSSYNAWRNSSLMLGNIILLWFSFTEFIKQMCPLEQWLFVFFSGDLNFPKILISHDRKLVCTLLCVDSKNQMYPVIFRLLCYQARTWEGFDNITLLLTFKTNFSRIIWGDPFKSHCTPSLVLIQTLNNTVLEKLNQPLSCFFAL